MAANQDSELAKALGIDTMGDQAAMNRQQLQGYEDAASPGAPAAPATTGDPLVSDESLRESSSLEGPIGQDDVDLMKVEADVVTVEGDGESA
jgi:hypothetical protein